MKLCKVIATVVSTEKHPSYKGLTLLMCQPVDEAGKDAGDPVLAVDAVQAGIGDRVLVNSEGGGARIIFGAPATADLPIRSVIVGIVDAVES